MDTIDDRVAVITGGASGIGLAMAKRFASEGCKLVLADVDDGALKAAVGELEATGADVRGVVTDVSSREAIDGLRDRAIEAHGKVHILCNNAGVQIAGPMWQISPAKWEWIMGVNLWGVIHGVQSFVPHMIEHGEPCHIVNTASAAGLLTIPTMSAYCVTKHGVVALTECLAGDLKQNAPQIRASVLCPAFVQTNLHLSARGVPGEAESDGLMSEADEEAFEGAVKHLVQSGVQPEVIADAVYGTLLKPTLHIITHPETLPAVTRRAERIVERATAAMLPADGTASDA